MFENRKPEPLFILNWTESYPNDPINKLASEELEEAGKPPILLTFEELDKALLDYEERTDGYSKTSIDVIIPNEAITHELDLRPMFSSGENYSDFGETTPFDEGRSRIGLERIMIGTDPSEPDHFRGLALFIKRFERPQIRKLFSETFDKLDELKTYEIPVRLTGTISITSSSESAAKEQVDAIINSHLDDMRNYLFSMNLKQETDDQKDLT